MPQTFQVLKCYKCSTFQVHLAKKSNKWECKLCGEKQSVKRHYGIGTALECRCHVQKLNSMQGDKHEVTKLNELYSDDDFKSLPKEVTQCNSKWKSKWSAFIDEDTDGSDVDQQKDYLGSPICVSKKKKYEFHKTEISEDEHNRTNMHNSKSNTIKYQTQISSIKSNNLSLLVCNDDISTNSSKNILTQVTKVQKYDFYENESKEYNKCCSHIRSIEKKYPIQDCNIKSNKWLAYVSNDENVNLDWFPNNETHIENKKLGLNECIEIPKETTITENFQTKWSNFVTSTKIFTDKENNFNKEKQNLFSLSDDNDLDSILDF